MRLQRTPERNIEMQTFGQKLDEIAESKQFEERISTKQPRQLNFLAEASQYAETSQMAVMNVTSPSNDGKFNFLEKNSEVSAKLIREQVLRGGAFSDANSQSFMPSDNEIFAQLEEQSYEAGQADSVPVDLQKASIVDRNQSIEEQSILSQKRLPSNPSNQLRRNLVFDPVDLPFGT